MTLRLSILYVYKAWEYIVTKIQVNKDEIQMELRKQLYDID